MEVVEGGGGVAEAGVEEVGVAVAVGAAEVGDVGSALGEGPCQSALGVVGEEPGASDPGSGGVEEVVNVPVGSVGPALGGGEVPSESASEVGRAPSPGRADVRPVTGPKLDGAQSADLDAVRSVQVEDEGVRALGREHRGEAP